MLSDLLLTVLPYSRSVAGFMFDSISSSSSQLFVQPPFSFSDGLLGTLFPYLFAYSNSRQLNADDSVDRNSAVPAVHVDLSHHVIDHKNAKDFRFVENSCGRSSFSSLWLRGPAALSALYARSTSFLVNELRKCHSTFLDRPNF